MTSPASREPLLLLRAGDFCAPETQFPASCRDPGSRHKLPGRYTSTETAEEVAGKIQQANEDAVKNTASPLTPARAIRFSGVSGDALAPESDFNRTRQPAVTRSVARCRDPSWQRFAGYSGPEAAEAGSHPRRTALLAFGRPPAIWTHSAPYRRQRRLQAPGCAASASSRTPSPQPRPEIAAHAVDFGPSRILD